MGSGGIIIIRNNLQKPAFYGETVPANGIGKWVGKVKVWHVLAAVALISFVLGAVIF